MKDSEQGASDCLDCDSTMPVLIDGYNVLFAAGKIPRQIGPGALEQARRWLIQRLLRCFDTATRQETVVVFDAKDAPKHLPDAYQVSGIQVLFARDHEEADDLIEQRIRRESNPRRLLLVSSDFRLREVAARRRAKSMKSEDWLEQTDELAIADSSSANDAPSEKAKPNDPEAEEDQLSSSEVESWLKAFRLTDPQDPPDRSPTPRGSDDVPVVPAKQEPPTDGVPPDRRRKKRDASGWGPFPPGYGDDLLE